MLTDRQTIKEARDMGYTIRKMRDGSGEYRATRLGGVLADHDGFEYFTDSISDALDTVRADHSRRFPVRAFPDVIDRAIVRVYLGTFNGEERETTINYDRECMTAYEIVSAVKEATRDEIVHITIS